MVERPKYMAKVLLFDPLDEFLIGNKEFAPLGILYLSSWLKERGHDVKVIHGKPNDIEYGFDFYGFSATTPQYPAAMEAMTRIRKIEPDSIRVLGGAHVNAPQVRDECFEDGFTHLVLGEGEIAMQEIVEGKRDLKDKVIAGKPLRGLDLDRLVPDRRAIDIENYGYPLANGKALTVITARGCPFTCQFCSSAETSYAFRKIDNVIEEVDDLVRNYGANRLLFVDDVFTLKPSRLSDLLRELQPYARRGLRWRCYSRTDQTNHLAEMAEAGCIEVGAGIESGSVDILELIMKYTSPNKNAEFVRGTKEVGIKANCFIMVGLPGESPRTVEETRRWMEDARPEAFGYNIFMPYPDSPILQKFDMPLRTRNGIFNGRKYSEFITVYPYTSWGDTVVKAKKIDVDNVYVETPWMTRRDILDTYHREFEEFVRITGFDPRRRGDRGTKTSEYTGHASE